MKKKLEIIVKNKKIIIDYNFHNFLDHFLKAIDIDWDLVYLIDGPEGVGKTKFAVLNSFILSKGNFGLKNIIFTVRQFFRACDKVPDESVIMWDEAVLGLLSVEYMRQMGVAITKKLTTIRKKRLKIIILAGYYFMLTKYISVSRTKFLVHLHTPDFYKRGDFWLYSYKNKNKQYFKNKDKWIYDKTMIDFKGDTFYKENEELIDSIIDWDEYEIKKTEAIESINDDKNDKEKFIDQRNSLICRYIEKNKSFNVKLKDSVKEISESIELTKNSVNKIYSDNK